MQPTNIPAIKTDGLTKSYTSSVLALDSLDMVVESGEVFGFLGPNGAGKTTTIRLMLDLIRPTAGCACVFGLDSHRQSLEVRKLVGYLPGELELYRGYNGQELLRLFASLRPGQVSWDYVRHVCEHLDVDLTTPIGRLSHGNRQKIGLAKALMSRPQLLILDEPTLGLDPLAQHQVLELLREAREEGRTVFFSSHILPEVEYICDRVGIMRKGRLVTVESVEGLKLRRLQRMRITFGQPVASEEFTRLPGVRLLDATKTTLQVEVAGDVDGVLKAASRYHVLAVATEQATLEEVFLAYYQGETSETVRATDG
jgi:ABC-2 type transport system ATP-binding protein